MVQKKEWPSAHTPYNQVWGQGEVNQTTINPSTEMGS